MKTLLQNSLIDIFIIDIIQCEHIILLYEIKSETTTLPYIKMEVDVCVTAINTLLSLSPLNTTSKKILFPITIALKTCFNINTVWLNYIRLVLDEGIQD